LDLPRPLISGITLGDVVVVVNLTKGSIQVEVLVAKQNVSMGFSLSKFFMWQCLSMDLVQVGPGTDSIRGFSRPVLV